MPSFAGTLQGLRYQLVAVVGPYKSSSFSWCSWFSFVFWFSSWISSSLTVALAHSIRVQRRGGRWWVERREFRPLRPSHKTQRILCRGSTAATYWDRPDKCFFLPNHVFLGILHLHLFVLVGNKGKEGKVLEEKWCCSCQVHHPDCCIKLLRTSIEMASGKNEPMLCPHKYPSIGEYSKPIQQRGNSREA